MFPVIPASAMIPQVPVSELGTIPNGKNIVQGTGNVQDICQFYHVLYL